MKNPIPRLAFATAVVLATTALGGWAAAAPHDTVAKSGKGDDSTVTVYLTRHGQTILNTLERVQGWSDAPLVVGKNPDGSVLDGRILPVTVGANLRARDGAFDAAYSADQKRHFQTATLLLQGAGQQKLAVTQDERLREIDFGRYEGAEGKEMWTDIVEAMGYTVDHAAAPTAPADATGQNGGWQTMQLRAITEKGLVPMMATMKRLAEEPEENGVALPAEDCGDVSARMLAAMTEAAQKAVRGHDTRVLMVSSGLSITCAVDALGTTVTKGISNVAVSKLEYRGGVWTVKSVGDASYRH
ncbi:histidine phosphatase family protein [Microbacterium capsulatum]|uniref:phosphoglycerate mutase (2,3-diphosphoglycerate-dependent) n=1 Tax=Microbacterium capsulatum TaxID=3041921 RepID=A0ABU0XLQ9_9MICO|nr:histidine phosphatase family protein [Microbacterium sp. ASV81]MDQ4215523.1 histidine phosphatase family protein [Microbacterium sp. ASV81]